MKSTNVMNIVQRAAGLSALSAALILSASCDATSGGLTGAGLGGVLGGVIGNQSGHADQGAAIGAFFGSVAGSIIGDLNAQQRAKLQADAPRTYRKLEHNDEAIKERQQASTPEKKAEAPAVSPLSVTDVKALSDASVKPGVIIDELKKTKSSFSSSDVASAQSDSSVDSSVIDYMKKTMS